MNTYDFSGFDEAFKHLSPEDREGAERAILRYLELVMLIGDETETGEATTHERSVVYSGGR